MCRIRVIISTTHFCVTRNHSIFDLYLRNHEKPACIFQLASFQSPFLINISLRHRNTHASLFFHALFINFHHSVISIWNIIRRNKAKLRAALARQAGRQLSETLSFAMRAVMISRIHNLPATFSCNFVTAQVRNAVFSLAANAQASVGAQAKGHNIHTPRCEHDVAHNR